MKKKAINQTCILYQINIGRPWNEYKKGGPL